MTDERLLPSFDLENADFYETLGRVVFATSNLHMEIGFLFDLLLDGHGSAIFHVPQSDRVSIQLVEAAVAAVLNESYSNFPGTMDAKEKLLELCRRALLLLNFRNDLIHAPYGYIMDIDDPKSGLSMVPAAWSGSKNALRLVGKDVPAMLRKYESDALELAFYARELQGFMGPGIAPEKFSNFPDLPLGVLVK